MWLLKITFQLYLLATICAGQQEEACVDVQRKLQVLAEAVQTLCGSSTPPPLPPSTAQPPQVQQQCDCSQSVTWTSVPMTGIAFSQSRHTGTLAYDIPDVIPDSAKEVLVLAGVIVGRSGPEDLVQYVKIYTQQNNQQYEKYIMFRSAGQSAWNTNTDNLWFPMTSGRQVFVELTSVHTGNVIFRLHAIGYR